MLRGIFFTFRNGDGKIEITRIHENTLQKKPVGGIVLCLFLYFIIQALVLVLLHLS